MQGHSAARNIYSENRDMPYSIALVMITKNEAACLERCLSSVAGLVDEMIVVDTGSTDGTIDIASQLGARVYHFQWTNDFAAARNAALRLSNADWNLVLDADEWLISGQAELRNLGPEPFVGQIAVVSAFEHDGNKSASTDWISRLLPHGIYYSGRIHEQPDNDSLPYRRVEMCVGHDGYLPQRLASKQGRNEALLKNALNERPRDAYLLYQLGKELSVYDRYLESVPFFLEALTGSGLSDPFRHDLVVRTMFALKKAAMHEQAIQLAGDEFPHWQDSPDYFFCVADVFLDWAVLHPEQAEKELLPIVESSWLKCLAIGDQPGLTGSVNGRGSFLAAHNLAIFYGNTGRKQQAEFYAQLARKLKAAQADLIC